MALPPRRNPPVGSKTAPSARNRPAHSPLRKPAPAQAPVRHAAGSTSAVATPSRSLSVQADKNSEPANKPIQPVAKRPPLRRTAARSSDTDDILYYWGLRIGIPLCLAVIFYFINSAREKSQLDEMSAEFKKQAYELVDTIGNSRVTRQFVDENHIACLREAYVAGDRRHLASYDEKRYAVALLQRIKARFEASAP